MHAGPSSRLLDLLGIQVPIIQAPMAGVSSPAMAAAASNSGGLGSLGVGAMDASQAQDAVRQFRKLSDGPLNVNLFVHAPANADERKEAAWLQRLRPEFDRLGGRAPDTLHEIYRSFLVDDEMLAMLVAEKPRVVSFHFGLPRGPQIEALRAAGIVLLATATNLAEARMIEDAGLDAIVAQGHEAGGHRGMFDPDAEDSRLGTLALTRILVKSVGLPIIAAGGIMDGAGIAAVLALGAEAAQLGTAFIPCPESGASPVHKQALLAAREDDTRITEKFSGKPARGLVNRFITEMAPAPQLPFPAQNSITGKLRQASAKAGRPDCIAMWAGQGAPLSRAFPAAQLIERLEAETVDAIRQTAALAGPRSP